MKVQKQIITIENTLQEIENTTHQAWTGSPDYNGDPLKLNAARVAFNNAFINTTEADFVIPVAGNDDGYKSKAGNLRDPKLQSSGVGVPGTEITVAVTPKKKGDPTQQSTGTFREYYPNIGTLAYNPLTGNPEIATADNYKQLRAATFNPSNTQEAIPNKDKFVRSKQTGTMVPTEGYGVLEINTIGYTLSNFLFCDGCHQCRVSESSKANDKNHPVIRDGQRRTSALALSSSMADLRLG